MICRTPSPCVMRTSGWRRAFSLPEVIAVVLVVSILATTITLSLNNTRSAIVDTKLKNDVSKLNYLVTLYQAGGGTLDGLTNTQDVLDKLKTQRSKVDANTTVGMLTGSSLDPRLSVRLQNATEAASNAQRVFWNTTTKQFVISTSGAGGVAAFVLSDALADTNYGTETRTPTNVTYNADAGWVWGNAGTFASLPSLNPLTPTFVSNSATYDPSLILGGGGGTLKLTQLGAPVITPTGGNLYLAGFPTQVTISPGTAVLAYSILNYKVVHTDGTSTNWAAYGGPVSITYGDTVMAKNITTNSSLYTDSTVTSQTYTLIPTPLPSPAVTPGGGSYAASVWPSPTILSNDSSGHSKISYRVTNSSGVSTAWSDYGSGNISVFYGDTIQAKNVSLDTTLYTDSPIDTDTFTLTGSTQLPPPLFSDYYDSSGKRYVVLTFDSSKMQQPTGVRIYYTLDGSDPGINGTEDPAAKGAVLYDATKRILVSSTTGFFNVTARCYPPSADKPHWDASDWDDYDIDISPGLAGGHIDVDTSHLTYPLGKGTTDGHVHAYDDKYNVSYVNMMGLRDTKLKNIQAVIPAGTYFKLIVSNGSLSPGLLLSINKTFNTNDKSTYTPVTTYQSIPISSLPLYTTDGATGSTKLTQLSANFQNNTVAGVINTVTGFVRTNKPGLFGEARNGAVTIQAVKCDASGNPLFTTDLSLTNGGVHGVAKTGLLWECTIFYHWHGGAYGQPGWQPAYSSP